MLGYIYKFTNSVTGEHYIGQTICVSTRYRRHMSDWKKLNTKFYTSIRAHGIEIFSFSVIFTVLDSENLNYYEQLFIKEYDSFARGYNSNIGGNSSYGFKHRQESKDKIRKAKYEYNPQKGNPLTPEHKEKIASKMRGELGHFYGKTHTEESRRKISIGNKGKIISEKQRMCMSVRNSGKGNPMHGTERPEVGAKNKETKGQKVMYEGKLFSSLRELSVFIGKSRTVINKLIQQGLVVKV